MFTKLLEGRFLVNGVKSELLLDESEISWSPIKQSGKKQITSRVSIVQIIGIKNSRLDTKNECCDKKQTTCSSNFKALKVYYSKNNGNRSGGQLLKLKKLSIKSVSSHHLRDEGHKICSLSNQLTVEANEDNESNKKRAQQENSRPPSCYASEDGTSNSSNKSSSGNSPLPDSPFQNYNELNCNQSLALDENNSSSSLDQLIQQIEELLKLKRKSRPKRLLIFVNPFGGKGRALHLYNSQVHRLLELANVEVKLVVTKYANHAKDTIEDPTFQLEQFDGIVCVGGDGMFSELMNGLLFRYNHGKISRELGLVAKTETTPTEKNCNDDKVSTKTNNDTATEHDRMTTNSNNNISESNQLIADDNHRLSILRDAFGGIGHKFESPPIPVGVIGAGSTDANSFGLIGTNDVITATLNIILGNQIKIDVCSVHSYQEDSLLRFVSTFVAYGYFGDVIRESEKLRWLGPSRYDVTGFNNLIKNRTYKGSVNILTSNQDGSPYDIGRCHVNCEHCEEASKQKQLSNLELGFVERTGSFVGINAAVTACRCPQTKKGFSPNNHLANGCTDLILVRPCTRMQYIQYLLRTGWTKKSAFDLKYVEAYRCRQFEFVANQVEQVDPVKVSNSLSSSSASSSSQSSVENGSNSNSIDSKQSVIKLNSSVGDSCSSWNVDGEILNEQSIRVKVNNQLLRVFGTGEPQL